MGAVGDARGQIALAADEMGFDNAAGARTRAHPGSDPGRPGCSFPTMPNHLSRRKDGDHRVTMTVPEAAEVLGMSESATYEAVARGEIPSVRIGRRSNETSSSRCSRRHTMSRSYRRASSTTARFFCRFGPASYHRLSVSSLLPVIEATVR